MKQIFKSVDSILIDQPTDPAIKDSVISAINRGGQTKLKVTIDATHSGVITNRRVYPAKYVSTGYKSFFSKASGGTAEYDKPVLKHHSMDNDAIGRVINATFTPLKQGVAFEKDYMTPEPMGSRGSGVVTISAIITDPESIQKIIDGRYISVSAGHSTDSMTCSICDESIMKCDHWPGHYYNSEGQEVDPEDGFLCFYITGNMDYNEVSFVNMPAQPPAKLVNFKWEDWSKDKLTKDSNLLIQSMTRGKKSMVRDFSIVDDSGEYNLLKGTHKEPGNKVQVAMNTNIAQKTEGEPGETNDVHQKATQSKEAAKSNDIAEPSPSKDKKPMDGQKDTNGLDVKTLEASLQAVSAEREKLLADKAAAEQKIAGLESNLAARNSEIDRLTKTQTDMQVEMSKALATALASFRVKLNKPDAAGIDSPEKFNEYSTKLSKRTPESLRDALEDIIVELNQAKVDAKDTSKGANSANTIVSDKKVSNPSVVDTKDTTVQAGKEKPSKTQDTKSALDRALN